MGGNLVWYNPGVPYSFFFPYGVPRVSAISYVVLKFGVKL